MLKSTPLITYALLSLSSNYRYATQVNIDRLQEEEEEEEVGLNNEIKHTKLYKLMYVV